MQNIFEVGGQVSGESFIGRKAEVEKFRNEFLNSKKRKVYSVIGLARSGKTSFVKKIFENLPDNIFIIMKIFLYLPAITPFGSIFV